MRLSRPFFQLPLLFDVERMRAEVSALPAEAWVAHPDQAPGNSAVRLITADGGENDGVQGRMAPTPWLEAMPYLKQALAGFGVVWSRSRLMCLAPGARVPEHADINYHWHTRVRLHIPVFTWPEVRFHCDGETVHMGAGEAWVFDNWRRHHVENNATGARVHLVADTTGTAAFWRFVNASPPPRGQWRTVKWDPEARQPLLTEINDRTAIMPAAEVQWLLDDLRAELAVTMDGPDVRQRAALLGQLFESFVFDWRQLCALHGVAGQAAAEFQSLAMAFGQAARPLAEGLVMRANGAGAMLVLEKRVLGHLVAMDAAR